MNNLITKRVYLTMLSLFCIYITNGQPSIERRGVWLTTIYNLDYPAQTGTSTAIAEQQKKQLINYLDQLKEANFNSIFFQVRCRGTVTYNSAIEPWDRSFSGRYGVAPAWDPVAFAIEECHKRGMEFHAWFVVIPLCNDAAIQQLGRQSVQKRQPTLCKKVHKEWFLDPGNPKTEPYIVSIIEEFLSKYSADGIHLDYIRYPDNPTLFPDKEHFIRYAKGVSLEQWRRNNITQIATSVNDATKKIDPSIEVSSATIGRHRRASLPENNGGWTGYESVFQDATSWLETGKHDFIAPMLYYLDPLYSPLLRDWIGRTPQQSVAAGLGSSYIMKSEKDWAIGDFLDQISLSRTIGSSGILFFRGNVLFNNTKNLRTELIKEYFRFPATLPPIRTNEPLPEWFKNPIHIEVTQNQDSQLIISWTPPYGSKESDKVRYRLYAYHSPNHNSTESNYLIDPCIWGTSYEVDITKLNGRTHFKVAPIDRFRREGPQSEAAEMVEMKMN